MPKDQKMYLLYNYINNFCLVVSKRLLLTVIGYQVFQSITNKTNGYSTLPRSPELEPHHQIPLSVIFRTASPSRLSQKNTVSLQVNKTFQRMS